MRSLLRLSAPLVGLLIALVAVAPHSVTSVRSENAAVLGTGASTAHLYSNPVWWPLTHPSRTGCYKGNPGCPGYHTGWLFDVRTADYANTEPVYAMGAGIVHIGRSGQRCGDADTRGNWLYIDHGAGVLSYYGHLNIHLLVQSGEYVTARTTIGYAGNTGYSGCTAHPNVRYIFMAVKHGGTSGAYVEFTHRYACVSGARRLWPEQLPAGSWTRWNLVPNLTPVPASNRTCIVTPPPTSTRPTGVKLARATSTSLRATWTRASDQYKVTYGRAELQEYHPTIAQWLDERVHTVLATAYTSLTTGRAYRVRVLFRNVTGWSAPSGWSYYTLPR